MDESFEGNACIERGCFAPVHIRKRGLCRNCYARFLNHGSPSRLLGPFGAGTVMNRGYVRVRDGAGRRLLGHRLVAERVLGKPLPAGAVVHHVDENRANNAPANLVICPSRQYHELLHVRMNALAACGNASWRKCVICHAYAPPETLFIGRSHGVYHRACKRAYNAGRRA